MEEIHTSYITEIKRQKKAEERNRGVTWSERLQRAKKKRKQSGEYAGTGTGLVICKNPAWLQVVFL